VARERLALLEADAYARQKHAQERVAEMWKALQRVEMLEARDAMVEKLAEETSEERRARWAKETQFDHEIWSMWKFAEAQVLLEPSAEDRVRLVRLAANAREAHSRIHEAPEVRLVREVRAASAASVPVPEMCEARETLATLAANAREAYSRAQQANVQVERVRALEARAFAVRETRNHATQVEVRAQRTRMRARATRALDFVGLLVPKRIADEELGDAAEYIDGMIEQGRPRWQVYLKLVSTVLWVLFNAYRASGRRAVAKKTRRKKG
jgi:hypothetical protein